MLLRLLFLTIGFFLGTWLAGDGLSDAIAYIFGAIALAISLTIQPLE